MEIRFQKNIYFLIDKKTIKISKISENVFAFFINNVSESDLSCATTIVIFINT